MEWILLAAFVVIGYQWRDITKYRKAINDLCARNGDLAEQNKFWREEADIQANEVNRLNERGCW